MEFSGPDAEARAVLGDWLESQGRSEDRAKMLGARWCPMQFGTDRHGLWAAAKLAAQPLKLRWIPAGSFTPGHVDRPIEVPGFWLAATACRQREWLALMGVNPSHDPHPDRPVEQISWHDARAFAAALSECNPGLVCRLPSEIEWEYACRAGGPAELEREQLDACAWWGGNSQRRTHPVGRKQPNAWGLYDMLGNVAQWCEDELPRVEGQRPKRAMRGGSWLSASARVRADARSGQPPRVATSATGFRVAASAEI